MSKSDFILMLIKTRMTRAGMQLGLPENEAALHAETAMCEQGLRGFFRGAKALSTPDSAIVTMVESYICYIEAHHRSGKYIGVLSDEAIDEIERFRNRFWRGNATYSRNLFEYIFYRTELEIRQQFKRSSADMGLDRETVVLMIKATVHYFLRKKEATLRGIDFNHLFPFLTPMADAPARPKPDPIAAPTNSQPSRSELPPGAVPVSPSLPDLQSAEPFRIFADPPGRYTALLYRDVGTLAQRVMRDAGQEMPSMTSYNYVLAVVSNATEFPVHFITLEHSRIMDTVALCEFCPDGSHKVIDINGREYLDLRLFLGKAMGIAMTAQSTLFFEREAA